MQHIQPVEPCARCEQLAPCQRDFDGKHDWMWRCTNCGWRRAREQGVEFPSFLGMMPRGWWSPKHKQVLSLPGGFQWTDPLNRLRPDLNPQLDAMGPWSHVNEERLAVIARRLQRWPQCVVTGRYVLPIRPRWKLEDMWT